VPSIVIGRPHTITLRGWTRPTSSGVSPIAAARMIFISDW
jgi:hypothetical protein